MRRALAAAAVAALALTGCGSEEPTVTTEETPATSTPSESAVASESPTESHTEASTDDSGHAIEIEIEGDRIEPRGKRVEVKAGEPVTLEVESDRPAELHVHSSPEQVLDVKKGKSTLSLTIERPGIVDVEEHESGIVVFQLEVR
ncbi:MAG: hypothetical protein ACM3XQ_02205 [Nocardioidaceae bacterium]